MRVIIREFGFVSGLRAVGAGVLGVRRADGDVKGSVGVAHGRGENVRRPQVCASSHETRPVRAPAWRPRCGRAWPHPPCSRSLGPWPCPGIRFGRLHKARARLNAAQAQADRVDVLLGLHHCTVVRVQAPHPRVINLGIPKFLQTCAGAPGALRARASEAGPNAHSCPRTW